MLSNVSIFSCITKEINNSRWHWFNHGNALCILKLEDIVKIAFNLPKKLVLDKRQSWSKCKNSRCQKQQKDFQIRSSSLQRWVQLPPLSNVCWDKSQISIETSMNIVTINVDLTCENLLTNLLMTLESKSIEKNHKHLQRRCILLLVHSNSVRRHFSPNPDYLVVISSWIYPCQGQAFHLRDGRKNLEKSDHIHICRK